MSTSPPLVVADRYRLVAPLGQGGMGRVWRATDVVLHRDVAIKELVPPPGLTPDERREMRERSLREARAIARLNNINVVRVFDVLRTDADPWIVMEYVPSRSLQDTLASDGPVPAVRAAEIGLGVLNALRAAHRNGVVHRDVKPGNVLLGSDGRVVLTDFGLATVPGDPNVTRTGLVLGSPAYIAPERARDGTAGPAADLWSLGATLYAAVEGASPFARPTAIATLAALATENPPPARNAGPLKPVLNGLLRKDPTHRINADEAERLLNRATGRRTRLTFPMSPTMRRPGVGRERTSSTPPVVPGAPAAPISGSAPVVPGPRPPVSAGRPPGVAGQAPAAGTGTGQQPGGRAPLTPGGRAPQTGGHAPQTPGSRAPQAPGQTGGRAPQGPGTAGRAAAASGQPVFTPGKATVGRPVRPTGDTPTRTDAPDTPRLDATRVDTPPVRDRGTGEAAPQQAGRVSGDVVAPGETARGAFASISAAELAAHRAARAASRTSGEGAAKPAVEQEPATEEQRAVEEQRAAQEQRAAEEQPAAQEQPAAEEQNAAERERAAADERKVAAERARAAAEKQKAAAGQEPAAAEEKEASAKTAQAAAGADEAESPVEQAEPEASAAAPTQTGATGDDAVDGGAARVDAAAAGGPIADTPGSVTVADGDSAAGRPRADTVAKDAATVAGAAEDDAADVEAKIASKPVAGARAGASGSKAARKKNRQRGRNAAAAAAASAAAAGPGTSAPEKLGAATRSESGVTTAAEQVPVGAGTTVAEAETVFEPAAAATEQEARPPAHGAQATPGAPVKEPGPVTDAAPTDAAPTDAAPTDAAPTTDAAPVQGAAPTTEAGSGQRAGAVEGAGAETDAAAAGERTTVVPAAAGATRFTAPQRPAWQPMTVPRRAEPKGVTVFGTTLTRRQTVIGVAVLAALVLLLALLLPQAFGGDGGDEENSGATGPAPTASAGTASAPAAPPPAAGTAPQTTAPPTSAPPSSAAPQTSAAAPSVPSGWYLYKDPSGFSVPLPEGVRPSGSSNELRFRWNNRLLIIAQTDRPKSDPYADWQQQERDRRGDQYPDYKRIKLERIDYFQSAADWEFTYTTSNGNPQHAVKRNFLTSDTQAYSINWYTSPGDWNAAKKDLQAIYQGFKPKA